MISSMDGQTPASLGERLCRARMALGLTQEQLGTVVHVTDATINRYEKNVHRPDPDMLRRLADALMVRTDYLLGRTDDRGPLTVNESPAGYGDDARVLLRNTGDLLPEDREELLRFVDWLKERRKRSGPSRHPHPQTPQT